MSYSDEDDYELSADEEDVSYEFKLFYFDEQPTCNFDFNTHIHVAI